HNTIEGAARSVFDLEPNSPQNGARDVRITDNKTGLAGNFWLASKGSNSAAVSDITITSSVAHAPTGNVLWVNGSPAVRRGPWVSALNQFQLRVTSHDGASQGTFFSGHCTGVTAQSNTADFPRGPNGPAVEYRDSPGITVENNPFRNAGQTL